MIGFDFNIQTTIWATFVARVSKTRSESSVWAVLPMTDVCIAQAESSENCASNSVDSASLCETRLDFAGTTNPLGIFDLFTAMKYRASTDRLLQCRYSRFLSHQRLKRLYA